MKPILFWLFTGVGGILAVAGLALVIPALKKLAEAAGSKHWPTVSGKVVSSEVKQVTRKIKFEDEPEREVTEHKVEVRYEYTVNNVLFSGIDLNEGATQFANERAAQERVARFPAGAPVTVFYAPTDPTRSILEPGVQGATWIPLVIAVTLFVTGTAMVLISRVWLRSP